LSIAAAVLLALAATVMVGEAQGEAPQGRVTVELAGYSKMSYIDPSGISNLNDLTRQAYKYSRERWGKHFQYEVSGLQEPSYDIEISCVDTYYGSPGQRVFDVLVNGEVAIEDLDLVSVAGKNVAWQTTLEGREATDGIMTIEFVADAGEATISNIRLVSQGETEVELSGSENRHWSAYPLRFQANLGQDVHEVALGRMGSRFFINPVPQLLGFRQSPLGTWSEDLEELVLAFRDASGNIRALPFTDRYPLFSGLSQEDRLTGIVYRCDDPVLPFLAEVSFTAPFYPGDEKLSTAPFFYVDVKVENRGIDPVTGEFLLLRPHKDDNTGPDAPQPLGGVYPGYEYVTAYTFGDESRALPDQDSVFMVTEALAANDGSGISWHYDDITDDSWIWASPPGCPLPYPYTVYTYRPRGHSGLVWSFNLAAEASESRSLVMAAFTDQPVLKVESDYTYRFLYGDPAGPAFTSPEDVINYALGPSMPDIREKASFFDGILSTPYLEGFSDDFRDLASVGFQGFIINTWWCVNGSGSRWYSIWEGNCHYHSTVDVEYNTAWFYLYFWPDLLRFSLEQWTEYEKSNAQGAYLSHDIGRYNRVYEQTYPHDMPVEENADWLLMAYAYWKQAGGGDLIRDFFNQARSYAEFILNCDSDGDGLPDINVANTVDQGSPAVQNAKNQTYLGIKALAALRAAEEMALAQPVPDQELADACRERVMLINHTLEDRTWTGDHFRVCDDPSIPAEEAEAYSIYPSNGLLWLLSGGIDPGLDQVNLERLRSDLASASAENRRIYGDVHTNVDNENQWVSQNLWRDALGFYLGSEGWPAAQAERDALYWNLERYFATKMNGSFWDALDYYGNSRFNGVSDACSLGLKSGEEALAYLEVGNLKEGGARGACLSYGQVYGQSLGYYPRGVSCLALVSAAAGLRLDRQAGKVFYEGKVGYTRVPVLACADWANPDPSSRLPVLSFDQQGQLLEVANPSLLPSQPQPYREMPLEDLEVTPATISPDGNGEKDTAVISFTPPLGVFPNSVQVLEGEEVLRTLHPQEGRYVWDGRKDSGEVAEEGLYRVRIPSMAAGDGRFTPATEIKVGLNTVVPGSSHAWYLAEGYTGSNQDVGDFETWILVQNPGPDPAEITLTLMLPGGETVEHEETAPSQSRLTISVDSLVPEAECSARVSSDRAVVVERAMYFNGRQAGHATVGVTAPSTAWYLAEGYTGGDFDEWILLQNPGNTLAFTTLTLMSQEGSRQVRTFTVPAHSRYTVHVDEILPDAQVSAQVTSSSPLVVERAQYLNDHRAGTCTIASRNTSRSWCFAEGYCGEGFETWLLVQNPGLLWAGVECRFMMPGGEVYTETYRLPPRSRFTVPLHDMFPGEEVSVSLTSDQPVVAERAMYWGERAEGHATIGTPLPDTVWRFAEGYTAEGFEEWLLVSNPGGDPCELQFTFLFPDGTVRTYLDQAPGNSRYTMNVGKHIGPREVSIVLKASSRVVAERAMYFKQRSGGTCTIGALE
jgi:hypothetical protein